MRRFAHIPSLRPLVAPAVAAVLLAGLGALGWLLGHVVAYDAAGQSHAHGSHAHGYMEPVGQGGLAAAAAGILLAIVAIAVGRRTLADWVRAHLASGSVVPWLLAAITPAATFLVVEVLEGSAARNLDLLVVGLPLQVLIGLVVLWLVRELLVALVRVADRICAALALDPAAAPELAPSSRPRSRRRTHPIACNAALRAPPLAVP